jgi:hypothetical protein
LQTRSSYTKIWYRSWNAYRYRAQVDPDGFYAEADLLALYRADFPPQAPNRERVDRKIARNARLRARQAAALERMKAGTRRGARARPPTRRLV